MTYIPDTKLSLEQYMELEYSSTERYEYIDGKLNLMSYTSPNHGRIVRNLLYIINDFIFKNDLDSEIWAENRMLHIPTYNRMYYPDLIIVEGKSQYFNHKKKMVAHLNPSILMEVLSDSTEAADRTDKWKCYRKINTLQQYILISQNCILVEVYSRELPNKQWTYDAYEELDTTISLKNGARFLVKDAYRKVEFEQDDEAA